MNESRGTTPPSQLSNEQEEKPEIFLGEELPSRPPAFWSSLFFSLLELEFPQVLTNCVALILPALLTVASTFLVGFPIFGFFLAPLFFVGFFLWLLSPIPEEKETGRSLSIGCALSGLFVFCFMVWTAH